MGLRKKRNMQHTQRRMSGAQKRKFIALAGLILLCALFIIGIFYSSVYRYVHRMDKNQIEQNVFVQGIDVSGMTQKQALNAIENRWTVMKNTPVILKAEDKAAYVTLAELGVQQGDVDELINEAVEYGKHGNLYQRYRKIRQARKNKVEYEDDYKFDEEKALKVLEEKTADFFEEAVDAKITRVGGVFQITDEKDGKEALVGQTFEEIRDRIGDLEMGKEVKIEVDSQKDEPEICKKDLEQIEDEIGSASVKSTDENCRQELLVFAGKLNGTIVMPDRKCSLQETLGEYVQSKEFEGALSLAATALYDAALYAEVEIEERHEAETMPQYVDAGLEAVLDSEKDLRIKNTTESPIYIEAYINGEGEFVCNLYGKETREKERSISFDSDIAEKEEYGTVFEESDVLAAGKTKMKVAGSPKSTVILRKTIKEDGKKSDEETISTSEYKAVDQVISVGIKTEDKKIEKLLKEAIATQDEETIEKAVEEASKG